MKEMIAIRCSDCYVACLPAPSALVCTDCTRAEMRLGCDVQLLTNATAAPSLRTSFNMSLRMDYRAKTRV